MGKITRPHGIRGDVVVYADASLADGVHAGLPLVLRGAETIETEVLAAAPVRGGLRLSLRDVADRNRAEELVGYQVLAPREALPELDEGEYYDTDLIGMSVVTDGGRELGTVTEVVATGANDVYVVAGERGEVLVPAIEGVVLEIDLERRRILVEPSGLEYSGMTDPEPGER